ncbi:MAG: MBOAT family protein [Thermoanaerobaculaceae bacterium]|nr:MBOAT family protein [Thermoanaerobaculaceae bacterium]MDI9622110.1 MBOAT family O-acyltransferase [Acidobacteriota bacterium]NLH11604.1 MBOAT family protein [Holophagae bacterium]HPW56647.1 MBOAT family O-acyltransferase [Thermoanaerobaculaceae bacterium]
MAFTSQVFLLAFLPAAVLLHWLAPARARNAVLALSGLVLLAWAGALLLLPLLAVAVVDWACARIIAAPQAGETGAPKPGGPRTRRQKLALGLSLATNLGLLAGFKLVPPLLAWLSDLVGWDWALPDGWLVAVPLGLSFYTFQSLSYTIDVFRGHISPCRRLVDYVAYLAAFPRLIAGPIVRFHQVSDQLASRRLELDRLARGCLLFALGLGKKVLLANPLGTAADAAFAAASPGAFNAWFGLLAFAFQIYFDFSGYTDMALGLGLMVGLELPPNFDAPYRSASVMEFWRRWHLTLSFWLRDYVFLPVAYASGRRLADCGAPPRREEMLSYTVASMTTMVLCGLWHGVTWGFVVWGGLHGVWLVLERLVMRKRWYRAAPRPLRVGATFAFLTVSWVFFRAGSLAASGRYLASLFGFDNPGPSALVRGLLVTPAQLGVLAVAAALAWFATPSQRVAATLTPVRVGLAAVTLWLALAMLSVQAHTGFLYAAF